ncbi:MAG: sirohydrochlorin cobaltochelatase [Paenibacillaceae bacterium]|nr:sirohydrochlorin cobaltochelatase [Paenibacillaceae bacterium]
MQRTKAILAASFGTSYPDTLTKSIAAIENEIASAWPERELRRAFTSSMIIRTLRERDGMSIDNVEEALDRLSADGFREVIVQPTHIINGEEYEKLAGMCSSRKGLFAELRIGAPLLSSTDDFLRVIRILAKEFSTLDRDTALVLMGHGSGHFANSAYAAMDYMFKEQGHPHIFVGTVEAYPDVYTVLKQLDRTGCSKVLLSPLMVVAGDHATNDMAGDEEDSWKTIFTQKGYQVSTILKGLGEYPDIRSMYVEHIEDTLNLQTV